MTYMIWAVVGAFVAEGACRLVKILPLPAPLILWFFFFPSVAMCVIGVLAGFVLWGMSIYAPSGAHTLDIISSFIVFCVSYSAVFAVHLVVWRRQMV